MDFTDLVRRMRNAQKDYFRYQKQATLILAKQLEKEVDDLLATNTRRETTGRIHEQSWSPA